MAAADHQKRIRVVDIAAAGHQRDRLLAGIDQVPIDFVVGGRRTDPQDAVLAVQDDLPVGRDKVGNQSRQTDPEVDIGAVLEILRGPPRDLTTIERHRVPPGISASAARKGFEFSAGLRRPDR